ncbi:MAG: phenylalanine--tRNA ligase subunit beta [Imperialibacter sp.]|uniref:phenylalanine--tRNA ligase subunit beta n=1 Tax=Imperialibacter sp. TaxID=2038411 RepID=UPI0032F07C96
MKISYNWLKEYIDLTEKPEEVSKVLTGLGLEVEGLEFHEEIPGSMEGLVLGEVVACEPHPNADKLKLTKVDVGGPELLGIVCGAPNVAKGQRVVVATNGTTIHPKTGEPFQIKRAKIRGEESNGMICAEDEIGLSNDHGGVIVLDTQLPNGTPAADYFKPTTDYVFEIGLTPNRADATSHYGTARDLAAFYGRPLKFPPIDAFKADDKSLKIDVSVENTEACPRYAGVTLTGPKVGPSPSWLKARLEAIGLTPINNIVDVTNYICHGVGQPLHAFDAAKIKGGKVVVKTLPEGTKFTTLDEKERKLSANDLMICDAEEGMCIAGVFGGTHSGVSDTTTSIFLESAYFSPDYVRRTAILHGLKTDASFRFERGIDPNGAVNALKHAALLIKEVAGGSISSDIVDIYPQPIADFRFKVRFARVNMLIGKDIGREAILAILKNLQIGVEDLTSDDFTAVVPPYRVDVQREIDVVEEVLRVYGIDNIELSATIGAATLSEFPAVDDNKLQLKISEFLAARSYYEIITNSLTNAEYGIKSGLYEEEQNVVILNRLSEELGVMRQSMLFSGLEVVAYNNNHRQANLKFFEFGKTYHKKDSRKYREQNRLALFATGASHEETWRQPTKAIEFYDLSAALQQILNKLNISGYETQPTSDKTFESGLDFSLNGKVFASIGQVNKKALKLAEVRQPVFYADIDWKQLLKWYKGTIDYTEVPKFPEVRRDLSIVLDKSVSFSQVERVARQAERRLIKGLNVFSVYEGDKLEAGKKSYAISFTLQDEKETLKDKQIDKTMNALIAAFESQLGAIIRK